MSTHETVAGMDRVFGDDDVDGDLGCDLLAGEEDRRRVSNSWQMVLGVRVEVVPPSPDAIRCSCSPSACDSRLFSSGTAYTQRLVLF